MVCIISGVGRFPHFARICCLMTLYAKEHQVDGFIRWLVWHVWKKCLSISKKPEGVLSKKNTEKNAQLSKETFRNLAKKAVRKQLFFSGRDSRQGLNVFVRFPLFLLWKVLCIKKKMKLQFFPKTPRWGPDFLYLGPEDPRLFHMPNDTERILMLFTARTWGETQPGLGMGWSWKVPEIWSRFPLRGSTDMGGVP